jgi:mannose-6-phosphate isomerase-like protein (cupin superfamily)
MTARRIVTGHDAAGKAVFLADGTAPQSNAFSSVPGFVTTLAWTTKQGDGRRQLLNDLTLGAPSWLPPKGGSHLMVITFPPDAVMTSPEFDPVAAGSEYLEKLPGLADQFEADNPGMHQTDTIDYGIVLQGQIVLELDDGATALLNPGDVVVQNGTRHAWRNPTDTPTTLAFVLLDTRA